MDSRVRLFKSHASNVGAWCLVSPSITCSRMARACSNSCQPGPTSLERKKQTRFWTTIGQRYRDQAVHLSHLTLLLMYQLQMHGSPNAMRSTHQSSNRSKTRLKKSADGAYVSTMDCIYAHLWKTLSSLPFSITSGKEIGMLSVVEGRTKFYDPPVPNLLGNVVTNMRAPNILSAELSKMPLSTVASKIRDKIITTSRETWLSPERLAEAMDAFLNVETLAWAQTCWSSFPLYKLDFGFGGPFFAPGLNIVLSYQMLGMTYVGPPTPGVSSSAAFVQIVTTPQVVEALEHHPDFLPFFLPRKSEERLRR